MRGLGIVAFGAFAFVGHAAAGPWAQGQGNWYARALITDQQLDGVAGNRLELYGEYGFAEKWTVTAKSEAVQYELGSQFDREANRLTIRRELVSSRGWTVGVEAGAVYGSAVAGVFGCEGIGGEVQLSGGLSGTRGGRNFYAFADVAAIRHEDGCQRQKLDIGYGVDLWKEIYLSQQLWIERGNVTAKSDKYETQLGYHFPWADVAVGYRDEFGGAFDEQAVLIAVTLRG